MCAPCLRTRSPDRSESGGNTKRCLLALVNQAAGAAQNVQEAPQPGAEEEQLQQEQPNNEVTLENEAPKSQKEINPLVKG